MAKMTHVEMVEWIKRERDYWEKQIKIPPWQLYNHYAQGTTVPLPEALGQLLEILERMPAETVSEALK